MNMNTVDLPDTIEKRGMPGGINEIEGALPDLHEFGGALKAVNDAPAFEGMDKQSPNYYSAGNIPAPTGEQGGARGRYKMGTQRLGNVFGPDPHNPDGVAIKGLMIPETDRDKTIFLEAQADGSVTVRKDLMSAAGVPEATMPVHKNNPMAKNIAELTALAGEQPSMVDPMTLSDDQLQAILPTAAVTPATDIADALKKATTGNKMNTTIPIEFTIDNYGTINTAVNYIMPIGAMPDIENIVLIRRVDQPGAFTPQVDATVEMSYSEEGVKHTHKVKYEGLRFPLPMDLEVEVLILTTVKG
jgi:hypothetical protein